MALSRESSFLIGCRRAGSAAVSKEKNGCWPCHVVMKTWGRGRREDAAGNRRKPERGTARCVFFGSPSSSSLCCSCWYVSPERGRVGEKEMKNGPNDDNDGGEDEDEDGGGKSFSLCV